MHILLTRPLEDCSELIIRFKKLGHIVSHMPLLKIEKKNYDDSFLNNSRGIIFTSANAIKFLDIKNIDKNIKCFCVGLQTEKKAKSIGFQNIICAEGNVRNLKELIMQNFETHEGNLVYVSGEIISMDLDLQLINEGYDDIPELRNCDLEELTSVFKMKEGHAKRLLFELKNICVETSSYL